ncbi:MAG TPA: uroporphyrinogen-III synthase [Candidatus Acidoferrales bacterium]|nr:uroporphyrinogen-III synthase [Candidatus Acidoferrales bacterium]
MSTICCDRKTELPLAGWRILVSRAKTQAGALSDSLRQFGAQVLEIPFIEIRPPRSYKGLDDSVKLIGEYDWLILTSVNGVNAMFERMATLNVPTSELERVKIVAIGPATRSAIEKHGLKVAVTPKEYVAESIVEALSGKVKGLRVLLCRAKIARDVIPRELRKMGAYLDVVEAYETVIPQASRVKLRAVLRDPKRRPHVITFTSSSTVKNYVGLLGIRSGKSKLVTGVLNASIGPVTSETLRHFELSVDLQATEYTIPGLVAAIVRHANSQPIHEPAVMV